MKNQNGPPSSNSLSLLCQDFSKLSTRFALNSFEKQKNFSIVTDILILLLEYFQLLSLIFLINSSIEEDVIPLEHQSKLKGVISFARIFQPGSWVAFNQAQNVLSVVIMAVLISMLVLKYWLFGYIVKITLFRQEGKMIFKAIWRFIFKIQGRVLCQFFTSFWIQAIVTYLKKENNAMTINETGTLILGMIIFVTEYGFSFFLLVKYCYLLPAKNWLASKNNHIQFLNLMQKFIIQILQMTLASKSISINIWTITTVSVCLNIFQIIQTYKTLPLYNLKALRFQTALLMILTSLNLACFIQMCAQSGGYEERPLDFIVITWIILSILCVRVGEMYLKKLFFKITSYPCKELDDVFLVQKAILLQELRRLWDGPNELKEKYGWCFLLNKSVNVKLEEILNIKGELSDDITAKDINNKDSIYRILVIYLTKVLTAQNSKNNFTKLYLAYLYARKIKFYGFALRFIYELELNGSWLIQLNCELLRHEIESSIQAEYITTDDDSLSILSYLNTYDQLFSLKDEMLEQAELQIKCYQEILIESPDLTQIYEHSQKASKLQLKISSHMQKLCRTLPHSYYEHLRLFAEYSLRVNYSLDGYTDNKKMYAAKYERYYKFIKDDDLNTKTFYDSRNVLLVFSGRKGEVGKISYLSKNGSQLFGGNVDSYIGSNVSSFVPVSCANFVGNLWKNASEKGDRKNCAYSGQPFLWHKDGYLVLTNAYMCIHPYVGQGLYFGLLMRPIDNSNIETLFIKENGEIECATRKVAKKLGLLRPRGSGVVGNAPNLKDLCEEFGRANKAFNTIEYMSAENDESMTNGMKDEDHGVESRERKRSANKLTTNKQKSVRSPRKEEEHRLADLEEAKELHQSFSAGKELIITPFQQKKKSFLEGGVKPRKYLYNCKLVQFPVGGKYYKMAMLEEIPFDMRQNRQKNDGGGTEKSTEMSNTDIQVGRKRTSFEKRFLVPEKNDSDVFEFENEKQDGWINFLSLGISQTENEKEPTVTVNSANRLGENNLTTTENLYQSPMTSPTGRPFITLGSHRSQLLLNVHQNKETRKSGRSFTKISEEVEETPKAARQINEEDRVKIMINEVARSINSSKLSKSSQQRKLSMAYKSALDTRFYPNFFQISYSLFYGMIATLYATQILLHAKVDETVVNITQRKEILENAQLSNFFLVNTAGIFRVLNDAVSGQFSPSELGILGYIGVGFRFVALDFLHVLNNVNQDLLAATEILNEENMNRVFTSDVKIYDQPFDSADQTFLEMDIFSGMTRIFSVGSELLAMDKLMTPENLHKFGFIYRNALNDLFIRNQIVSQIFLQSVKESRSHIERLATATSITMIVLFFIITLTIIFLIWKQYEEEKYFMIAITRLNGQKIKELCRSVNDFKRTLNSQHEMFNNENGLEDEYKRVLQTDSVTKYEVKRESGKNPRTRGITLKYIYHMLKMSVVFCAVIVMSIYFLETTKSCLRSLDYWQTQDYFAKYARTRGYLAQVISQELLSAPLNATIENISLEDHLKSSIKEIANLRVLASTAFKNEDGTYEFVIQQVLYEEACSFIDPQYGAFCNTLIQQGFKTGFIYMLDALEDLVTIRLERYQNSDKSPAALRDIKAADLQLSIIMIIVVSEEAKRIEEVLNEKYKTAREDGDSQRNGTIIVFSVVILVLAVCFWVFVLKRLRACYNNFKNVLRTLPVGLVLSSFGLKSFLMKSSKGSLDFVKNQIQ